jgi:uncharacterized protein (TIGR02147 family)
VNLRRNRQSSWVSEPIPVNVFAFRDYRAALRALYAHKKAHEYGFSHRAFSRRAGLKSTNFLKLVMDGERNLSSAVAPRFAAALGLTGNAAEFFCELVQYNQAATVRERSLAHERMLRLQPQRAVRELDAQQSAYHAHWYVPAIRELAARADFRADPSWIARVLEPGITSAQASKALAVLTSLGLLRADDAGNLRPVDEHVSTGLAPLGHHVAAYHRAMLERASEALDLFPREEREIASLTLCIDESRLPELKTRMQKFRRELMHFAEQGGDRKRVVQVNFQLFPLSKKEK